jgi:hypothetical protein
VPPEIEMPDDWDDHTGWEAYYSALPSDDFWYKSATTSPGSFSFEQLGSLIDDLHSREWLTVWFPGCGFSPLPRAFSHFGFTVHATDIAPSAIEFQANNSTIVEPLLSAVTVEHDNLKGGSLISAIHDFRTPLDVTVDVIFNIKSIQALPAASMDAAAQSHFAALRDGGLAFFDTMNVQGDRRDLLEDKLADAGFYVPLHSHNKWYRKALADTGIPHMFVLGAPMIPQRDDYPYPHARDSAEYKRDIGILRDLTTQYRSNMQAEFDKEQETISEDAKQAQIIYSTG